MHSHGYITDYYKEKKMAKDIVCGMEVNENDAAKAEYEGETYYFCHANCRLAFTNNPEKYLNKEKD